MRSIDAAEFKAKCLPILDEVSSTGQSIMILKRGEPVAQLVPLAQTASLYPQHELFGTVKIHGDLLEPAVPEDNWDAARRELE